MRSSEPMFCAPVATQVPPAAPALSALPRPRWSPTGITEATRGCALVLVGLVLVLFAPIRTTAATPGSSITVTPLRVAVAEAFSAPAPPNTPVAPAAAPGVRAVDALTAKLIDGRARAARPQTLDLGSNLSASVPARDFAAHTASVFGERHAAIDLPSSLSITGAAVAVGAPDVSRRGGIGTAMTAGSGSGGATSAVITGLGDLPLHAGFTVARDTTRTGTIHASIQPLDRPG